MKTTIELSDALFNSAKELARSQQSTLRALVEEGLRRVLADSQTAARAAFVLKDARVRGGQLLVSDPRQWQEMELDSIAAPIARSTSAQP